MATLKSILSDIITHWSAATNKPFEDHPMVHKLCNTLGNKVLDSLQSDSNHLNYFSVEANPGVGNWTLIPSLSIVELATANTNSGGLCLAYLFKADGSGVYLSLNQDVGSHYRATNKAQAENLLKAMPELALWGITSISLLSDSQRGKALETANIIARYYPLDKMPTDKALKADLLALASLYKQAKATLAGNSALVTLPKPFILLAGISGTGKTRFVREQAKPNDLAKTYLLVSVRPDWHEPGDLLGYISRLGEHGAEYIVTDVLRFMVTAWIEINDKVEKGDDGRLIWHSKDTSEVMPYWLCLDEMNLAPVEQYFADYLSVLETRCWHNGIYTCDPLIKPEVLGQLNDGAGIGKRKLRAALGLSASKHEMVWRFFLQEGISIPFNLLVAGTVNMDETTHGFSRKVIDRALTIDFGVFFPNHFSQFFTQQNQPKQLDYPTKSHVTERDFDDIIADPGGRHSMAFLDAVNDVLRGSSFELAYRALNELLVSVVCFQPANNKALQAVWDDFLMFKVLPRIDGDSKKLNYRLDENNQGHSLLSELENCLKGQLADIWEMGRIELLLKRSDTQINDSQPDEQQEPLSTACRSRAKLAWMKERLNYHDFTSFWP